MKVLLVGNHTCGNRGDGAILRGLIDTLRAVDDRIEVDTLSRFATSSAFLLGETILQDPLYAHGKKIATGRWGRISSKLHEWLLPRVLAAHVENKGVLRFVPIPEHIARYIEFVRSYDLVIQVGGSFFVDLYGSSQFEHALCALLARRPIHLVGHSVGPFQKKSFKQIAKLVFGRADALILREQVSQDLLVAEGLAEGHITMGADTAFLVDPQALPTLNYAVDYWLGAIRQRPAIAFTFRKLAPFDVRLGVSQEDYEARCAEIIDNLCERGYQVIALSTCTGIDGYARDDRMVALSVGKKLRDQGLYHVVMDELNDVELGILLKECVMTVGTRLHSTIISMNFGTPAVAINYEHKSRGIMQKLGLPMLSSEIQELENGVLMSKIDTVLAEVDKYRAAIKEAVAKERALGVGVIEQILKADAPA